MTIDKATLAELLPCPFCGGAAEMRSWDWPYERWQVRCSKCKAHARARMAKEAEAITAWNTRAPTDREAVLEELIKLLDHRVSVIGLGQYVAENEDRYRALASPTTTADEGEG